MQNIAFPSTLVVGTYGITKVQAEYHVHRDSGSGDSLSICFNITYVNINTFTYVLTLVNCFKELILAVTFQFFFKWIFRENLWPITKVQAKFHVYGSSGPGDLLLYILCPYVLALNNCVKQLILEVTVWIFLNCFLVSK